MGAREVLQNLSRSGLSVTAVGADLVVRPASKLTDELRAELLAVKPDVLALLNGNAQIVAMRPHALTRQQLDEAHAAAWNEKVIETFVGRAFHFVRLGFNVADADDLSELLHLRDVRRDDRVLCIECQHHRLGTRDGCANEQQAGPRLRGSHAPTQLQRCPGFRNVELKSAGSSGDPLADDA
jgi:hypothetical protein